MSEFIKNRKYYSNYFNKIIVSNDGEIGEIFNIDNDYVFVLIKTKLYKDGIKKPYDEYYLLVFYKTGFIPLEFEEIDLELLKQDQLDFLNKYKEYYNYLKKYYDYTLDCRIYRNNMDKLIQDIRNYLSYEIENKKSIFSDCNIAAQCKSLKLKDLEKININNFESTERHCIRFIKAVNYKYKTNKLNINEKINKYVKDYLRIVKC